MRASRRRSRSSTATRRSARGRARPSLRRGRGPSRPRQACPLLPHRGRVRPCRPRVRAGDPRISSGRSPRRATRRWTTTPHVVLWPGRAQLAALAPYELGPTSPSLHRAFDYYAEAGGRRAAQSRWLRHPIPLSVGLGKTTMPELIAQGLTLAPSDSLEEGRLLATHAWLAGFSVPTTKKRSSPFDVRWRSPSGTTTQPSREGRSRMRPRRPHPSPMAGLPDEGAASDRAGRQFRRPAQREGRPQGSQLGNHGNG